MSEAEPKIQWISLKEVLPPQKRDVLFFGGSGYRYHEKEIRTGFWDRGYRPDIGGSRPVRRVPSRRGALEVCSRGPDSALEGVLGPGSLLLVRVREAQMSPRQALCWNAVPLVVAKGGKAQ